MHISKVKLLADPRQSSIAVALNLGLDQIFNIDYSFQKELNCNNVLLTTSNINAVSDVEKGEIYACIVPHDGVSRLKKTLLKQIKLINMLTKLPMIYVTHDQKKVNGNC